MVLEVSSFQDSVTSKYFPFLDPIKRQAAKRIELSWHLSQHYFAECMGEQVIENLLPLAPTRVSKMILMSQAQDEIKHRDYYKSLVDQFGLDSRAGYFAQAYSQFVMEQKTFGEKVFAFHILTESVSAAYCQWRLGSIEDPRINFFDHIILEDEEKHLAMGSALLKVLDSESIDAHLNRERIKEMIQTINHICLTATSKAMEVVQQDLSLQTGYSLTPKRTSLDSIVARRVIEETRQVLKSHQNTEREVGYAHG